MTDQNNTEMNSKGQGFSPNQKHSASQTSTDKPAEVSIHIGGMRNMARSQLSTIRRDFAAVHHEYIDEAQVLVDDISQAMADMASGRLIYEAVADNVDFLLQSVKNVPAQPLGKHSLSPLSLKRLRPATRQNSSIRSIKGGVD